MARIELFVVLLGTLLATAYGGRPEIVETPAPPTEETVVEDIKTARDDVKEKIGALDEQLKKLEKGPPADLHEVLKEFKEGSPIGDFRDIIEDIKKGMNDMVKEEDKHELPRYCANFADAVFRKINDERKPTPEGAPGKRIPGESQGPPEEGGPGEKEDLEVLLMEDLRCIHRGMERALTQLDMAEKEEQEIIEIEEEEEEVVVDETPAPVKRSGEEDEDEDEDEDEEEGPHRDEEMRLMMEVMLEIKHLRAATTAIRLAINALENKPKGPPEGSNDAGSPPPNPTKERLVRLLERLLEKKEEGKPKPAGKKPDGSKPGEPKPDGKKPKPKSGEEKPTKRNLDPLRKYFARHRP